MDSVLCFSEEEAEKYISAIGKGQTMENEEQDYKNAMRAFYNKYIKMRKIYNMRLYDMSCARGMEIKIYRETLSGKTVVVDVQEENETQCYKRALEELKSYETIIATA